MAQILYAIRTAAEAALEARSEMKRDVLDAEDARAVAEALVEAMTELTRRRDLENTASGRVRKLRS